MAQNMSGSALNPQNVIPIDTNTSTIYTNIFPPYQNVSSGNYMLMNINPLSDVFLQTTDRGNVVTNYFSFSTPSQLLIGTPSSFLLQNKNDCNYLPIATRFTPFQFNGNCNAVVWNGIIWLAGGGSGSGSGLLPTIASSIDGFSWVPRDVSIIFTSQVYGFGWNGSIWVACGSSASTTMGNTIATSPDGITWTGRGSYLLGAAGSTASIGGQTMARCSSHPTTSTILIGQNAAINFYYGTADALNVYRFAFSNATAFWYAAWNGNLWLATSGTTSAIYTSTDGIIWTTRSLGGVTATYGVAYSTLHGIWIVTSNPNASNTSNIQYSYDTITWTAVGPATNTNIYYDVQWSAVSNPPGFIAVGNGPLVAFLLSSSITAGTVTFTTGTAPSAMTNLFSTVYAQSLGLWIIVGTGASQVAYGSAINGSWISYTSPMTTGCNQIAWAPSLGVMVVAGEGTHSLMYSTTGLSFIGLGNTFATFTTRATGVVFNTTLNQFVATGTGVNTFLSSPDGINWGSIGTTGVDAIARSVAWSPLLNLWTMVGNSGNHSIATSIGGTTWVGRTGTTVFTTGFVVIWIGGALNLFVAGGTGTAIIATSTNGIIWTARTSNLTSTCFCMAWNGTIILAGGASGTVSTSPDGITWTSRTPTANGIAGNVSGCAFSPTLGPTATGLWVLTGSTTNTIIYQAAIIPLVGGWTAVTSSATTIQNGYAVAWNPTLNHFLLGGGASSGTLNSLLTSNDGILWTGFVNLTQILYTVNCVAWNGTHWVAGGIGSGGSQGGTNFQAAWSPDGIGWSGIAINLMTAAFSIAWSGVANTDKGVVTQATNGVTFNQNNAAWVIVGLGTNTVAYSTYNTVVVPAQPIFPAFTSLAPGGGVGTLLSVIWYPLGGCWVAGGVFSSATLIFNTLAFPTGTWTAGTGTLTNINTGTGTIRGLSYGIINNSGVIVAVGNGTSNFNYAVSTNGRTNWVQYSTTLFAQGNGIAYNPNSDLFVVTTTGAASTVAITATSALGGVLTCTVGSNIVTGLAVGMSITLSAHSTTAYNTTYIITSVSIVSTNTIFTVNSPVIGATSTATGTISAHSSLLYTLNPAQNNAWIPCNNALITSSITTTSVFGGGAVATGQGNAIIWNGYMFIVVGQGPQASTYNAFYVGNQPPAISGIQLPYTTIATSSDGINWRSAPTANSQQNYLSVGYRHPITVCGGSGNAFMGYSLDNGLSWIQRSTTSTSFSTNCFCIAYNGYVWLAGGTGGQSLLVSTDGVIWNTTGLSAAATYPSTTVFGIAWANSLNLWCCVGYGPNTTAFVAIATAGPDGRLWTPRGQRLNAGNDNSALFYGTGTGSANAIAWNGTFFLVLGFNTTSSTSLVYSRDGINWAFAANNSTVPMTNGQQAYSTGAIAWNGNLWVVVTNQSLNVFYSSNMFTWSTATPTLGMSTGTNASRCVAWNGSLFIMGGFGGNTTAGTALVPTTGGTAVIGPSYATSPDGINWTVRNIPVYGTTNTFSFINTVIWHPISSIWIMGVVDSGLAAIQTLTSSDGINWVYRQNNTFPNSTYYIRCVAFAPTLNTWVIGGLGTTSYPTLCSSPDGVSLIPRRMFTDTQNFYAVAWNGTQFVAGGTGGSGLAYSSDAINWVNVSLPSGITGVFGIAWGAGTWVVVGSTAGGSFRMATGPVTSLVTHVSTAIFSTGTVNAIATDSTGQFVAVATGTNNAGRSATGLDGSWTINNTSQGSGMNAIAYSSTLQLWIGGGIGTSAAGQVISTAPFVANLATTNLTWLDRSTYGTIFTAVNAIAAGQNVVVAVGIGASFSIAYSVDGINWTGVPNSLTLLANGFAVAWNGIRFVAGGTFGQGHVTSPDGINWTSRKILSTGCFALGFQQREKTLTINNSQWTGRTSQQNFRILG